MKNKKRFWGVGLALVSVAAACAPEIRELGDGPLAGTNNAGAGTGSSASSGNQAPVGGGANGAGSGSVPSNGGSQAPVPGAAGEPTGAAGEPPISSECFSPTRFEHARAPGAIGCECEGEETACVDYGGNAPPVPFECVDGRWKVGEGYCPYLKCFTPTSGTGLALSPGAIGCPCTNEPPECVRVTYEGEPRDVSLYCTDGHWAVTEDGACGEYAPGCKVGDVSYPSGAKRVKSPFSFCNECDCVDGQLVNCGTNDCADTVCDSGSSRARRCLGCGPVDNCTEYEIGCLSGEGCDTGLCSSPWCG